jgi:hypothetical protein
MWDVGCPMGYPMGYPMGEGFGDREISHGGGCPMRYPMGYPMGCGMSPGMWDVGCGMWYPMGCGMSPGMWDVGCGMWDIHRFSHPSCIIHHLASERYSAYEKSTQKQQKTRGNYGIFLNFDIILTSFWSHFGDLGEYFGDF